MSIYQTPSVELGHLTPSPPYATTSGSQDHSSSPEVRSRSRDSDIKISLRQSYAKRVLDYFKVSVDQSFYQGEQFESLARFLNKVPDQNFQGFDGLSWASNPFILQRLLVPARKSDPDTISVPNVNDRNVSNQNRRILFLRGYPSPEWLNEVGSTYQIDPEFLRRHLDGILPNSSIEYFDTPPLPSSSWNIFQLRFTTIGARATSQLSKATMNTESMRHDAAIAMNEYTQRLRRQQGWRLGHSVIREYELYDEEHFSIAQNITLHYVKLDKETDSAEHKEDWLLIIWLDCSLDLTSSPEGPWLRPIHPSQSNILHTKLIPVLQHRDKIALTPSFWAEEADGASNNTIRQLPQTASRLHLEYGRMLDPNVMAEDPFYALNDLFHFFASSEVQLLNMIGTKLERESRRLENMAKATVSTESSQANLLHSQRVLEKHIERINDIRIFVNRRGGGDSWPCGSNEKSRDIAQKAAQQLDSDLEYLHKKAESLRNQGERAMTMAMSIASISEARRGIQQAQNIFKFTILASIYVPLSFTTSIMGMNVKELGQGILSIWVFFVISVPVFMISLLFVLADWTNLGRNGLIRWIIW